MRYFCTASRTHTLPAADVSMLAYTAGYWVLISNQYNYDY